MIVIAVKFVNSHEQALWRGSLNYLQLLSNCNGVVRGEIAVKLVLVAVPLRPRLSFEIRVLCEAQSDAHSELTPNHAVEVTAEIREHSELTRHMQRSPRPRLKRDSHPQQARPESRRRSKGKTSIRLMLTSNSAYSAL